MTYTHCFSLSALWARAAQSRFPGWPRAGPCSPQVPMDRSDHATQVSFRTLPSSSQFKSWPFLSHPLLEPPHLELPPNNTSFEDKIPDLSLTPLLLTCSGAFSSVFASFSWNSLSSFCSVFSPYLPVGPSSGSPSTPHIPAKYTDSVRVCPCLSPPHLPLPGNPTRVMGRCGFSTDDSPTSLSSTTSLLSFSSFLLLNLQIIRSQLELRVSPHNSASSRALNFCQQCLNHPHSRF